MKLVIVLHHRFKLWRPPAWVAERLRQEFPDLDVSQFDNYGKAAADLAEADAVVTWSFRPEQVAVAKKLRWIHSPSAAVHQFMIPEIMNRDIILTNASSVHAPVVAEHAIALMFALAKNLHSAVRYQQNHVWAQQQLWDERPHPREIAGATLGIVGLGSIGRAIAARAVSLGMNVIATRLHPEKGIPADVRRAVGAWAGSAQEPESKPPQVRVLGQDGLDLLLSESDYVVLCAPLLSSTQSIVNGETIGKMKSEACLINVGRGSLVDEAALSDALRQGRIGAAALDVFETEPLPVESPLWDMPNVLITPHSAAMTEKLWSRHYSLLSENLQRFLAGQPLLGVVSRTEGY